MEEPVQHALSRGGKVGDGELPVYSMEVVRNHCTENDGWFVREGIIYDATQHLREIKFVPGKTSTFLAILRVLGTDCTKELQEIGHSDKALAQMHSYRVGKVLQ
jgi:cytochrome b involved in lipid metabolism